ncbi:hypothetical protein PHYBOEH_003232 [Phytophthora boehmeriae]|uniref:Serine hydrolase domain-containing protein n=1 Tax=Phytophthora boehmeriae TaxID=109152 RepID=A0A8T1X4N9_9STRA|nr:hypothetical protein PHYBOEH_003232 [Phytophthora boehmeriae]
MASDLPTPVAVDPPRSIPLSEKIRVLCLHGYGTNKEVMFDQTRGIREVLGSSAEFVFVNGPYQAKGPSEPIIAKMYGSSTPFYEWYDTQMADGRPFSWSYVELMAGQDPPDTADNWILCYKNIEQSMATLDAEIRRCGPFDVIIGFSQGAILLSVMTMWYLHHGIAPCWKLAVCVSGLKPRGINIRSLFEDKHGQQMPIPLPSIHVIGKADPIYLESCRLAESWTNEADGFKKWVFEHDGGHKFPSVSQNREFYVKLGSIITQHCRNETGPAVPRL